MPNAFQQTFTASPTGRSSATLVALGCNHTITPLNSGRIFVTVSGVVANGTTTDGVNYNIYYGTGTAPSNNDAVSGTALYSADLLVTSLVTSELSTYFAASAIIGAVTPLVAQTCSGKGATVAGTTYWIDVMFKYQTGGTVTFTGVSLVSFEL